MFADGKWTTVVPATKSPKLNAGPNARNEIKVTTLNNVVTLYLNSDKASEIYVQAAPMAGGSFGVYAEFHAGQEKRMARPRLQRRLARESGRAS